METIERIMVITVCDSVVSSTKIYCDLVEAEEKFTRIALEIGADSDEMEDHLEDGYYVSLNTHYSVNLTTIAIDVTEGVR